MSGIRTDINPTPVYQSYNSSAILSITNWVTTNDNRYMCCWLDPTTKQLNTGYCNDTSFLTTNYAINPTSILVNTDITVAQVYKSEQLMLCKRTDGKVILIILNCDFHSWVRCYISNSGNGGDWLYYSTIYDLDLTNICSSLSITSSEVRINIPLITSTGRWVFVFRQPYNYYNSSVHLEYAIAISDNEGATWTITKSWYTTHSETLGQPCQLPDGSIFFAYLGGLIDIYIVKSLDNGVTWSFTETDWFHTGFGTPSTTSIDSVSFFYDILTDVVYAFVDNYGDSHIYQIKNPIQEDMYTKKWTQILYYDVNSSGYGLDKIYLVNQTLVFSCALAYQKSTWIVSSGYIPNPNKNAIYYINSLGNRRRVRNTNVISEHKTRNLKHKKNDSWGGVTL